MYKFPQSGFDEGWLFTPPPEYHSQPLTQDQYWRSLEWLNSTLERRIARQASLVIATSEASVRSLETMRDRSKSPATVRCIRNGYDPDDFPQQSVESDPTRRSRYRLVYAGTLFSQTSVAPLVEAVRRLCETDASLGPKLELVFAGRRTPEQESILKTLCSLPVEVVLHPYLDHAAAVKLMRSADLLCSILSEAPGAARALTAKVFEYMAARRPILAITPPGDLWNILDDYPAADRFSPSDVTGIAAALSARVRSWDSGAAVPLVAWDGARYDRREQAKELAALLSTLADGHQTRR
jgi:glycosyltransferase involved in cell wall biosynthesis